MGNFWTVFQFRGDLGVSHGALAVVSCSGQAERHPVNLYKQNKTVFSFRQVANESSQHGGFELCYLASISDTIKCLFCICQKTHVIMLWVEPRFFLYAPTIFLPFCGPVPYYGHIWLLSNWMIFCILGWPTLFFFPDLLIQSTVPVKQLCKIVYGGLMIQNSVHHRSNCDSYHPFIS